MELYCTHEDIGIYFFVLALLGTLVRVAVGMHWINSSQLVIPSLALQTFVVTLLGMALYMILRWRHPGSVVPRLGWVLPGKLYSTIGFLAA